MTYHFNIATLQPTSLFLSSIVLPSSCIILSFYFPVNPLNSNKHQPG